MSYVCQINSDLKFKKFVGAVNYIKFGGVYSIKQFVNDAFTLSASGSYSSVNTFTANVACKIKRLYMYASGHRTFNVTINGTTYTGNQDLELNVSLKQGNTFTITTLLAATNDVAIVYIELD